jgi:uncharacterized protein YndB with AHSA1/START domain
MTAPDAFAPAGPDRWSVRLVRRYPHPVETVWRAVSEPEHLAAWFPSTVELDPQVGGEVRFGPAFDGDPGLTGEVLAWEPPHLLAFTWDADAIRFELAATDDGTELVLLHAFDDRAGAASFAAGWDGCGLALAAHLAGDPPPPPTRAVARHEELVASFGLDRPAVDEVDDDGRWRLVFERQMVAPEADVRALLGTTEDATGTEVEIDFVPGTGHGARLVVTLTGTAPAAREAARTTWHDRIESAAAEAAHQDAARTG